MTAQKAVIYCRVSNVKQTTNGNGLDSQETRCREFATYKSLDVVEVFRDDVSGGRADRPGMMAMLSFLKKNRRDPHAVLIDDVSRLARGLEAHLRLRAAIAEAGGLLQSPSIEFGEDSDSMLVENLLASVSQHQRQKNAEQTKNRMRSRVMNGYWVYWPPKGFKYEQRRGEGRVMVRDEPVASIVQEALEGFASGRFATQAEVQRFLTAQPDFPRNRKIGTVHPQSVNNLLTQVLYAGYIEAPDWDVSLRKAKHDGLIDLATFEKIQDRLGESAKPSARPDLNEDFPLRGFVTCGDCGKPLTACWSTSKNGRRYPYYQCFQKGCESARKSIARDKIEGAFAALLRDLSPSAPLLKLAAACFRDIWDDRLAKGRDRRTQLNEALGRVDRQIEQLLDRIVETSSVSVIAAYENRIAALEKEKLVIAESLDNVGRPTTPFREKFEHAMAFLTNPWKLWENEDYTSRRTVLKLVFADRLAYCRKSGFRTPELSLPFKVLGDISGGKMEMARPGRFELPTS